MKPLLPLALSAVGFGVALLRPAAAEERENLRKACIDGGHAESCEQLGDKLARGALPSHAAEEPGLYLALACEGGRTAACDRAATFVSSYSDYETLETDVGCMLRDNAFACEEVATALRDERDEGVPAAEVAEKRLGRSRMRRAEKLYTEGCDKGDAEKCLGLGRVYASGFGVALDLDKAGSMALKACDLGLASACERAADDDVGVAAKALYDRACSLPKGSPHACLKRARAEEELASPEAIVVASYQTACQRRAVEACDWVSRHAPLGHPSGLQGERDVH